MNCKPGDLAVVVRCRANPAWVGHVLRVVRLHPIDGVPHWVCEPDTYVHPTDGMLLAWMDRDLRSIRDNDGTDETLTWAPKPEKVEA